MSESSCYVVVSFDPRVVILDAGLADFSISVVVSCDCSEVFLYMEESITRSKANEESNFFLCIGCTFSMP